ncbi:MAG: flavodoxin family protein [Thermodesulfobacteriota bacterium]
MMTPYGPGSPEKSPDPNDLIFACSPHEGGSTDFISEWIAEIWKNAGYSARIVFLRDYNIQFCRGCGKCSLTGRCVLEDVDDCRLLFEMLRTSRMLCFCVPIYFYHIPAQFKAWIDRSQSVYSDKSGYWIADSGIKPQVKTVFAAGRKRGNALFAGSELTLKYFLSSFGRESRALGLLGIEDRQDLFMGRENILRRLQRHVFENIDIA